jgi:hypothetical protein
MDNITRAVAPESSSVTAAIDFETGRTIPKAAEDGP